MADSWASTPGITIPMDEAWSVKTVGEAYKVYCRHAGGAAPQPGRGA